VVTSEPEPKRSNWPIIIVVLSMVVLAVVLVIGIQFSSTGSTTPGNTEPTSVDSLDVTIDIIDYAYQPPNISVPNGARVTWVNDDKVAHTATEKENSEWDTEVIHQDQGVTVTFQTSGTFTYYCTIHPYMLGTLTVR
jgi:plastocyanin